MSVLIRGMKMPKNCLTCKLRGDGSDSKYIWDCPFTGLEYTREEGETRRLDDCPLIEVPAPHGRLIDADAVAKRVLGSVNQEDAQGFMFTKIICQILKDAPTIIPAEEGE